MRLWQVRTSPLVAMKLAEIDEEPCKLSKARYRLGVGDCDGLVVVFAGAPSDALTATVSSAPSFYCRV